MDSLKIAIGPYCITFEWRDGDAWRIDLENDH